MSKLYDVTKQVALVWLPAAGTFYFAMSQIWHLPHAADVVGSITALDTFLGAGVHVSKLAYTPPAPEADGNLVIDRQAGAANFQVRTSLNELESKGVITLKVVQQPGQSQA